MHSWWKLILETEASVVSPASANTGRWYRVSRFSVQVIESLTALLVIHAVNPLPACYLDLALIFLRFRLSLRMRFFLHCTIETNVNHVIWSCPKNGGRRWTQWINLVMTLLTTNQMFHFYLGSHVVNQRRLRREWERQSMIHYLYYQQLGLGNRTALQYWVNCLFFEWFYLDSTVPNTR